MSPVLYTIFINDLLTKLAEYAHANEFQISQSKSKVVVFGRGGHRQLADFIKL